MTKRHASVIGMAVAFTLGLAALTVDAGAAPRNIKTVVLDCKQGWRAGAGGSYGGIGFNLSCANGRDSVKLEDPVGSAYNVRIGVEDESIGADCAYFGDDATVTETCIAVKFTIR